MAGSPSLKHVNSSFSPDTKGSIDLRSCYHAATRTGQLRQLAPRREYVVSLPSIVEASSEDSNDWARIDTWRNGSLNSYRRMRQQNYFMTNTEVTRMETKQNSSASSLGQGPVGIATMIIFALLTVVPSHALKENEAANIDDKVTAVVKDFESKVPQAQDLMKGAKGVLVMPATL
jgi:hypothetical protein